MQQPKELEFANRSAERDFTKLPEAIKLAFLAELMLIMQGKEPEMDKAHLKGGGLTGTIELKINGSPAWRCVYYNKDPKVVLVLHSFKKTAEGADKKNIDVVRERLKLIAR